MVQKMEINGKQEKVFILQTWHIILMIVAMVFLAGGSYGISQYRIGLLEARTANTEGWIESHKEWEEHIKEVRDQQWYEVQVNLRKLLEKNGLVYQELSQQSIK